MQAMMDPMSSAAITATMRMTHQAKKQVWSLVHTLITEHWSSVEHWPP